VSNGEIKSFKKIKNKRHIEGTWVAQSVKHLGAPRRGISYFIRSGT